MFAPRRYACSRHNVIYISENTKNSLLYIAKPEIAQKRARLSRNFFQATSSKVIHADNISCFFFKLLWNLGEKYFYVRNPTSISLFPIPFNGKNEVLGLPVGQKLIR